MSCNACDLILNSLLNNSQVPLPVSKSLISVACNCVTVGAQCTLRRSQFRAGKFLVISGRFCACTNCLNVLFTSIFQFSHKQLVLNYTGVCGDLVDVSLVTALPSLCEAICQATISRQNNRWLPHTPGSYVAQGIGRDYVPISRECKLDSGTVAGVRT